VWALVVALCLVAGAAARAQFRSGVETVLVTVTVTDAQGRLITGLARSDFEVFEDGDEQPVTQFTDERLPISLGVLLDASDSMRGRAIVDARAALDRFVGELLEPGDEAFVTAFNHLPRLVAPWTRPPAKLTMRLDALQPTGGTAIYDALTASAPLFENRETGRAAVVLISDGADTASSMSLQQARDAVRRTNCFVYAIALDPPDGRVSTRVNPEALRELTGPSGGYTEVVHGAEEIGPATERIANELNLQYTIGYAPQKRPDGQWRSIRVRVKDGAYVARARRGYFAVGTSSGTSGDTSRRPK
jgi:Ca-activated chloride channel family protein